MRRRRPLSLEKYNCFFVDPWDTVININNLNDILDMHGFIRLHHEPKGAIMRRLVGQVDLQPPRRSTLHRAAAAPPSAALITAAQARADVEALGWAECPIGCVAAFAAPAADAPEPAERVPRPADFVVVGRRPRSKRTRSSAYRRERVDDAASAKVKACAPQEKVTETVKEEKQEPSPPPRWMRSPTPPPPPPSPPRQPSSAQPLPPQDVAVAPPPPAPCGAQPTLAPIPAPPCWGTPSVQPLHPPQLYWGLPLPTPGPAKSGHGLPSDWASPTVPSCYPAPFWGAPSVLPPLSPSVPWGWLPPHGTSTRPPMHLQQEPFLAHLPGQQPPPPQLQTPPAPLQLRHPPPHLQGQPPPLQQHLQGPPPPHWQGPPPPGFF